MPFSLEQLLWSVRTQKLNVTAETAASLVLALAEQLALAPRVVAFGSVSLTQSGQLMLDEGLATSSKEADRNLRRLLKELMQFAGGDHPALVACARGECAGLDALCAELSKALVPMNRAAAKRGLARLHRRLELLGPPAPAAYDEQLASEAQEVEVDIVTGPSDLAGIPCVEGTPIWVHTPRVLAASYHPLAPACVMEAAEATAVDARLPPVMAREVGDRTPFLGSIECSVSARQSFRVPRPESDAEAAPDLDEALELATEDVPTAVLPRSLYFGRFRPQRSRVDALLQGFGIESFTPSERGVQRALRRCVGLSVSDAETSCTPPPVSSLRDLERIDGLPG